MRRGFTLIELLVASALMGMLVTILTMIFNQSSIAWQVGEAGVSNLKTARCFIGRMQDQLDNTLQLTEAGSPKAYRLVSLWPQNSTSPQVLRSRTIVAAGDEVGAGALDGEIASAIIGSSGRLNNLPNSIVVPSGSNDGKFETYIVNVKSGGPRNDVRDWEAIWSYPDDPSEW